MCTLFLIGITWLFKMASTRRVCVNHPDNFCYACGQYTPKQQCRNITKGIQLACKYYFDCKLGDQDKEWAPHVCCAPCNSMLSAWMNGKRKAMPFLVLMVWREPKNHFKDCYFCMTNIVGFAKKTNQRSHTQTVNLQKKQYLMMKQIHHQFHQQIWLTPVPLKSLLVIRKQRKVTCMFQMQITLHTF